MYIPKFYYLIEIQYLGFRYHGWQKQPNVKTVQQMVEKTVEFVLERDNFTTLGASRTDKLVSAQTFTFQLNVKEEPIPFELDEFLKLFNDNLPSDIKALSMDKLDKRISIIHQVKEKEYVYLFSHGEKNHPYCAPYIVYQHEKLDIELMKEGAKLFVGEHSFKKYCTKPSKDAVFIRTVSSSFIEENHILTANFFPEESYAFRVKSKGFMRHQVRLMMGVLFDLGKGKIDLSMIKDSLEGNDATPLSYIAPPSGLMLYNADFIEK